MRAVIVPEHQHGLTLFVPFRAKVDARWQCLCHPPRLVAGGEFRPHLLGPRKRLRVVENHESRISIDGAVVIFERNLEMQLRKERQIDSAQLRDFARKRSGSIHEHVGCDGRRVATRSRNFNGRDAIAFDTYTLYPSAHDGYTRRLRFLEHVHAKLLSAQPSAAARVQYGHDITRQECKVFANRIAIEKQICTR